MQRITTLGFCLNVSSPQETCPQRSQGKGWSWSPVRWSLRWGQIFIFGASRLCREVWARFLAFESNIGDLASILKVERRRFSAFKDEYEGKETALLVDRYKFMDLYPCSTSELKALGYKVQIPLTCLLLLPFLLFLTGFLLRFQDVSRAKLAALLPETVVAPSVPTLKDEVDRKPEYPKPDTNQMIPFQPRHLARMQKYTRFLFVRFLH